MDAGLARQAGEHLAEAGRKAAVRMDVRAVDKLLTRSLELLDDGHTVRPAVALGLAEALTTMGQPDRVPTARPRGGGHRDVAVRHGRASRSS